MSIVQSVQALWLIARKHALQNQLFENNERLLHSIGNPMDFKAAYKLDLETTLSNMCIETQLKIIDQQEKSLGKKLNIVA